MGDRLNATFSAACNAVRTRWEVILVHLTPASNEVLRNQGVTYKDTEASLNGFSLSVQTRDNLSVKINNESNNPLSEIENH